MIHANSPLLLVGCGNMGYALANSWRASCLDTNQLLIVQPSAEKSAALSGELGVVCYESIGAVPQSVTPSAICLATKPNALDDVLRDISSRYAETRPVILSVAAGKVISFYEMRLWNDACVIRIMPNTPALVGLAMSVCISNQHATAAHHTMVTHLFESVGAVAWLNDESLMDAATAISGSGPAYVFYFAECLINAATELGLSKEHAVALVSQTILGASHMIQNRPDALSQLRENVTSPGGTTEAALCALQHNSGSTFADIIKQAALEAKDKSSKINAL